MKKFCSATYWSFEFAQAPLSPWSISSGYVAQAMNWRIRQPKRMTVKLKTCGKENAMQATWRLTEKYLFCQHVY